MVILFTAQVPWQKQPPVYLDDWPIHLIQRGNLIIAQLQNES